jgi:head-tail adaptor
MDAGGLYHRIEIFDGNVHLLSCWSGIEEDDGRVQSSLRVEFVTRFTVRYRKDIRRGMYVRFGSRLFYVEGVTALDGKKQWSILNASELAGSSGVYQRLNGAAYPVLVFVSRNTPYIGENGELLDYLHRIEIPAVTFQPPYLPGDTLELNSETYTLRGIADGGDDGVVIQLMA